VGVAKSLYLADAVGTPLVPLFDVRGKGLDTVTTWCYWPSAVSPTGYIGGDILFNAALRS
jgi:hypothetical protein